MRLPSLTRTACAMLAVGGVIVFTACSVLARNTDVSLFQNPSRDPRQFGTQGAKTVYVVLGDSTAAGQGGDYEKGIAIETAQELAATRRVAMVNLAVSGARAADVVIDQLPLAERLVPDIAMIVVGANDVTHLTSVTSFRNSLLTTVQRLRTANPGVSIVMTGAPDMGSPPRIPALLRPLAGSRTATVNRMVAALADELRVTFAPIAAETGPLFRSDPTLFSSDDFHPHDRGYATWVPVLNRALARAVPKG